MGKFVGGWLGDGASSATVLGSIFGAAIGLAIGFAEHFSRTRDRDTILHYYQRGLAHSDNGQFDEAIRDFNAAIRVEEPAFYPDPSDYEDKQNERASALKARVKKLITQRGLSRSSVG